MNSSRPIQYEERSQIDTRLLLAIVVIGLITLWASWRLTQLPLGVEWWHAL